MARPATAAVRLLTGEREPVRLASTANIALNGLQTIDGVATAVGDRVLVKNQADGRENGIYTASEGQWFRAADARTARTMQKGTTVHVQAGAANAGNTYSFQTDSPTIGTSAITIVFYISDTAVTAAQAAATNAAASASAASASQGAAATSATNAATSATNASNSATAASGSASSAATSATNAGNSATAAAGSASSAATSATNAGNSATAAAGSASAAAASAAAINLPAPAADTLLVRNAGNSAYITQTRAQFKTWLAATAADISFLQSGTGAVTSTVEAKLRGYISVKDFGAIGDGSTDDTAAIQAAVTAVATAGGGVVYFPRGTYKVTSTTTCTSNNVLLVGAGLRGTQIITASATADVFSFGTGTAASVSGVGVRDMLIGKSVTRTAGSAINFNGVYQAEATGLLIANMFRGITVTGASKIVFLERLNIADPVPGTGRGIDITGNSNDVYLTNLLIVGTAGSQPESGIHLDNCNGIFGYNASALQCGNGLYINPGNGQLCENLFFTASAYDTGVNGIVINASGTGAVRRAEFLGTWSASNTTMGTTVDGGTATIDDVKFIGHRSYLNGQHGCIFARATNISLDACLAAGNSISSAGTYHGIAFGLGATKFAVRGCRSGSAGGMGNTQGYNIAIADVSCDNFIITGNDLTSNLTGALLLALPTSPTRIVHSNLGVSRVVPDTQIASVKGTKTALTNNITTAQAIFAAANDALLVRSGETYRFKAKIGLNTGATSHTTAFGLGGTATFTSIAYTALTTSAATATTPATPQMVSSETASATVLNAASTAARTDILIEGEMEISTDGTIIPQVTFSAGPTGTCEVAVDSFFEIWAVGLNSANAVGDWS